MTVEVGIAMNCHNGAFSCQFNFGEISAMFCIRSAIFWRTFSKNCQKFTKTSPWQLSTGIVTEISVLSPMFAKASPMFAARSRMFSETLPMFAVCKQRRWCFATLLHKALYNPTLNPLCSWSALGCCTAHHTQVYTSQTSTYYITACILGNTGLDIA